MQIGIFEGYGYGVVAANKEPLKWELEVNDIEHQPMNQGGVSSDIATTAAKGHDGEGEYTVEFDVSGSIQARWLPLFQSYTHTPPDMAKGQRVYLLKLKGTQQYFWIDIGLEKGLKRQETVIIGISAAPDSRVSNEFDPKAAYYIEASSHTKTLTLQTSKALGEPVAFTGQFNLEEGLVILESDNDHNFKFDPVNQYIGFENSAGTSYAADKQEFIVKAPKRVFFDAPLVEFAELLKGPIVEATEMVKSPQGQIGNLTGMGGSGGTATLQRMDLDHLGVDSIQAGSINPDSHSHG